MCNKCEKDYYGCNGCDSSCKSNCYNTCAPKCDPCKKQDKLYYCGKDLECLNVLSGDDLMKTLEVYGETICQIREDIDTTETSNGTHVEVIAVAPGVVCENGGINVRIISDLTGNVLSSNNICNGVDGESEETHVEVVEVPAGEVCEFGGASINVVDNVSGDIITSNVVCNGGGGTGNVVTVTGNVVDNTDPLNPVINLDFDDCCFEEVTVGEVNLLISNSDLIEGTTYKITGVHPTLYDDGTTSGTTIFLKALSKNKLTTNGHGIFYNPRYDQNVQGFGIYSNFMRGDLTSIVGNFDVSGRETVTTDNGAKGIIYTKGLIKYVSGDWNTSTSITGDNSGATANIANFTKPTYAVNSTVIWGGYVWRNLEGDLGKDLDILNLNNEWEKIVYNDVDYNKVLDIIEYDIENDFITRRYDSVNTIDVRFNKVTSDAFDAQHGISFNAIAVMQWGNTGVFNIEIGVKGLFNIKIMESYFENINFRGVFQVNITFDNSSYQSNITFDNSSYQNNFDFTNSSYQKNLSLNNASRQTYLNFDDLELNYGWFGYTGFDMTSVVGTGNTVEIVVPDLTLATNIFQTFVKEIVTTPNGTVKIKYLDDTLIYQFVDMDS